MNKLALTTTAILLAMTLYTGKALASCNNGEYIFEDCVATCQIGSDTYETCTNNGDGTITGRITVDNYVSYSSTYDEQETLLSKNNWYGSDVVPTRHIMTYENGKLTSETRTYYTSSTSRTNDEGEDGLSVETIEIFTYNENGKKKGYTIYTANDGLTREYTYTGYDRILKGTYKYTYDSDGNLTQKITYDSDGNPTGTETFAYDSDGNLTQKITYDSDENLTQKITYNSDGTTILGTETFAYDSDGNVTQKITYDSNDNIIGKEAYAKIFTVEQAYAATSKGNHNSISIRFK